MLICMNGSDSIGDSAIAGDTRWSGSYGVNVDFIARSHCSVAVVKIEDIQASIFKLCSQMRRLKPGGRVVLQDILEKFEFFPIKCRIQRALEIFQIRKDLVSGSMLNNDKQGKTKVKYYNMIFHCLSRFLISQEI